MKIGDVIYLHFQKGSFSWRNGLKVVININEEENTIRICNIEEDGSLKQYEDGRYMCYVTSLSSPSVFPTKLSYALELGFTFL